MVRSGLGIRTHNHPAGPEFVCACTHMRNGSRPRHARRLWRVRLKFASMHDLDSVFFPVHAHHLCLSRPGLLFDDATGDASPRVPSRIRLTIVRICVNHQRSAAFVENGVWPVAKCSVWVQKERLADPVCVHFEHEQVSSVRPFWIIFSVFLGSRIEMRTGTCESWTFTFADVVDVHAVQAGRQLRHPYVNANTAARGAYLSGTDFLSLCVDDIRVGGLPKPCGGPQKSCYESATAH